MCPFGGYLIGNLETRNLDLPTPKNMRISVRNTISIVTTLVPGVWAAPVSKHRFPVLSRNRDWRKAGVSQLLQIATLPYIRGSKTKPIGPRSKPVTAKKHLKLPLSMV